MQTSSPVISGKHGVDRFVKSARHPLTSALGALIMASLLFSSRQTSQGQADQFVVTFDIKGSSSYSQSSPVDSINDQLSFTGHRVITIERDTNNPDLWNTIRTNENLVTITGSGSQSDPGFPDLTGSWTYFDPPDDCFDVWLDTTSFGAGQLWVTGSSPCEDYTVTPPTSSPYDSTRWQAANNADNDRTGTPNDGLLSVPTNGQPFIVSGGDHGSWAFVNSGSASVDATWQVAYYPGGRKLLITSLQTPTVVAGNQHTFISTDTITLQATLIPVSAGTPVTWSVVGQNAASQVLGISEVNNTGLGGVSTFTFSPSQSATFVQLRKSQYTTGSRQPNDPLAFEIVATAEGLESSLSETGLGTLQQDETDTLRQEYVDFGIAVPLQSDVIPSLGSGYNVGNYQVQLSSDLPGHFQALLNAYWGTAVSTGGEILVIPGTAAVQITSGFRNPRRNKAVGSVHPNSKHVYGRALDLVPDPVFLPSGSSRQQLSRNGVLFPALVAAGSLLGKSIAEIGPNQVPVGTPAEDHVHVQW